MMRPLLLGLQIIWSVDALASLISFDQYHDQRDIQSYLQDAQSRFPNLVTVEVAGKSQLGRDIPYLVVQRKDGQKRSALFFNGAHHGNEWASVEATLGVLDFLLVNLNTPMVSELLDRYAVVFQPIVNPDGHTHKTREGATGTDINRDYAYPLKNALESFKSPESRVVRDITSQWSIRGAIAFHSGMEGVLWPSCFTEKPTLDHQLFYTLSKATAEAMGLNLFQQSFRDYPTEGEFIDYVYMKSRGLGLTVEVSREGIPDPSKLAQVVARSVRGSVAYMKSLLALDRGELSIYREPKNHHKMFGAPIFANYVPAN